MSLKTDTVETSEDVLKKLDWIIAIDTSGSMGGNSMRSKGKTRLEEVQEDVTAIARIAQKYDDDGITVITFSSGANVFDGVTAEKVESVFKEVSARGGTDLAAGLSKAVEKAKASTKEVVVFVFTDGMPDDQNDAAAIIDRAGRDLGRPRIGFVFVQVGDDPGATKFLHHLDSEMKVDVVATVKAGEAEGLSVGQLVQLARTA